MECYSRHVWVLTHGDLTHLTLSIFLFQKSSFQDSRTSDMTKRPSNADQNIDSPLSSISSLTPATYENSNVVIYEVSCTQEGIFGWDVFHIRMMAE